MDMKHLSIAKSTSLWRWSLPFLLLALCCLTGGPVRAEITGTPQQESGDGTMQNSAAREDDLEGRVESKSENIQPEKKQVEHNQAENSQARSSQVMPSAASELESRSTRYGVGYEYRMNRVQRPQRAQRPERPDRPQRPGR